ncbi:MAG: InlB B-repeat-containing protein [Clostridia bacterium]|nr:InlB B-repeat-containing protein [Clostridia bacterium]
MKKVLSFLLILLALFGLFACKKDPEEIPPETTYTVSFDTSLLPYAAATPEAQTVRAGECAVMPTVSAEHTAGYVLIWTTDPAGRVPYDFSRAVTGDLLLYATEVPRTYRVTYLTERGTVPASAVTSFTMETPTFELPTVRLTGEDDFGYQFLYWSYFDDPDSVVYEIEQGTEGDVILFAVIEPVTYEIYYHEAGDVSSLPKQYVFGDTLSLVSPSGEGFLGWTIYGDRDRTPVTELTPAFVREHESALFHGSGNGIGLLANWRESE